MCLLTELATDSIHEAAGLPDYGKVLRFLAWLVKGEMRAAILPEKTQFTIIR